MAIHAAQRDLYTSEMRFGVVMYGGVSLAIYINGVANELFEMASATPRLRPSESSPGSGTRQVYGWLSLLLADPALLAQCRAHVAAGRPVRDFFAERQAALTAAPRTRLLVDVISGTSAGGINGIFLAKALANNEPFDLLKQMWVHEGDIGKLLNDAGSREGMPGLPRIGGRPRSLLNGDRMYAKLLEALSKMSEQRQGPLQRSACADEIDLFVTTTDIRGARVALRLFDRTVAERRHRQVLQFRYDVGAGRNDFADGDRSFLAYAARCTSSFPFAFEPMTLEAIVRGGGSIGDTQAWESRFMARGGDGPADPLSRAYGDGGYLDNKPFSHAIEALTQREAEVPVERKLLYIEPNPQRRVDPPRPVPSRRGDDGGTPDAVSNALAALSGIPRYETIREDLDAVLARNRLIERVEFIVARGERDIDLNDATDPYMRAIARHSAVLKQFDQMRMEDMRQFYGDAFMPYRRLRVFMVTDKLADRLAQLWRIDPQSDRLYALRALVRVWRDFQFDGDASNAPAGRPTLNRFLDRFDLRYRTRRLRFLVRRVDALHRLFLKRTAQGLSETKEEMSDLHRMLMERLRRAGVDLAAPELAQFDVDAALAALLQLRHAFLLGRQETREAEADLVALGGAAAQAQRTHLREVLSQLLDVLLATGELRPGDSGAEGGPAMSAEMAALLPPEVQRKLAELSKLPSSTRTMQERIYQRARVLYVEMMAHAATPLQRALEADLDGIGELIGALTRGTPERPALSRVSGGLGRPAWQFVDTGVAPGPLAESTMAVVQVGDTGVPVLDTVEGRLLRRVLGAYYLRFDSYDQMSLPFFYGTNVGEPAKVEVVRISPEDATSLVDEARDPRGRRKLAGTALGNFGGFLDEHWRRNDIMWGRLDGAERLIDCLLPATEDAGVRAALRHEAHLAIVEAELAPGERTEITGLMMQALQTAATSSRCDGRLTAMLEALSVDDTTRCKQVESTLARLFEPDGLLRFVKETRDVDRRLEPARALGHAARAITVAGRVLEGVSQGHGVEALPRWMARGGLVAQALVAVTLPGRPLTLLTRHWLALLYVMLGLIFLLGWLFAVPQMSGAAINGLGVVAAAHVLTIAMRDVMRERPPLHSRAVWLAGGALLALAAVGGWALHRVPLHCLFGWGGGSGWAGWMGSATSCF